MANNRMYLRCNTCGAEQFLAKYYPSTSWSTRGDLVDYNAAIPNFIGEHSECGHMPAGTDYMWGDGAFSISYEVDERIKARRVLVGVAKYDDAFKYPILEQTDWEGIDEITPDHIIPSELYGKKVRVIVDHLESRLDEEST